MSPRLLIAALAILSATLAPAGAAPLRIAVVSDLNGRYGSTDYAPRVDAAIARIIELAPDLVLVTGDMVAGQRRAPKLDRQALTAMWDAFDSTVRAPLAQAGIPLAVTPGNHDASAYRGFALEREVYAEEWAERPDVRMIDAGTYPFAYAFSVGDVLFVSIDATTIGALPPEQMAWLERVLEGAGTRFRASIAFSHLPLWPFAIGREREIIADPALATLFSRAGVDLHLSGHHHAYYPGRKDGMLFVSQSCLGGGPRRLVGTAAPAAHSFTMVEIDDEGRIDIHALAAPDYTERVDHLALPERIVTPVATLVRMDMPEE